MAPLEIRDQNLEDIKEDFHMMVFSISEISKDTFTFREILECNFCQSRSAASSKAACYIYTHTHSHGEQREEGGDEWTLPFS
ncbi:hypothetical protein DV515_00011588 [Chloebia gouldiae]|uniref:Uncharacterized protein n=1 Tax=Chloebia gouldiae TaxID=44316 RepID=A0A3L8S5X3_CHLGU|nr:hypothetical protein DV515_00011588 [Chloebia gouldiae]